MRRSIFDSDPGPDTVAGLPAGLMAWTIRPGSISGVEAHAVVAYLQSLGNSESPPDD